MTDQEIEQRLRAWYRAEIDDRESAPFPLRASLPAFAQTAATSRRRLLPDWRLPVMQRFAPLAVAAVVVVAAAVAYAAVSGSNVGDLAPHASQTSTPSQAAPTATASPGGPTSTPSIGAEFPVLIDSVKDPGRYYIFGGGVSFDYLDLDVSAVLPPVWQRGQHTRGEFGIEKLDARLNINWVLNGFAENCQEESDGRPPQLDAPGLGPEVDDLASALAALGTVDASAPTNVSLAGWEGKRIELTVLPGCAYTYLWTWPDPVFGDTHSMRGQAGSRHQVTILDVAGRRLVIDASYTSETPEDDQAELLAIVESLEITPR